MTRMTFAEDLLPRSKRNAELLQDFGRMSQTVLSDNRMPEEAVDIGIQILRSAKIPKALREEIGTLRTLFAPMLAPVDNVS